MGEHCFLGWKIGDLDSVSKNVQWLSVGVDSERRQVKGVSHMVRGFQRA